MLNILITHSLVSLQLIDISLTTRVYSKLYNTSSIQYVMEIDVKLKRLTFYACITLYQRLFSRNCLSIVVIRKRTWNLNQPIDICHAYQLIAVRKTLSNFGQILNLLINIFLIHAFTKFGRLSKQYIVRLKFDLDNVNVPTSPEYRMNISSVIFQKNKIKQRLILHRAHFLFSLCSD